MSILPNQTLYISNLNDKIPLNEVRKSLYSLFSKFGAVVAVNCVGSETLRGQAFVVFRDVNTSSQAMAQMQNFSFFNKELKIAYAKAKSHVVARADGTYVAPEPKRKGGADGAGGADKRTRKGDKTEDGGGGGAAAAAAAGGGGGGTAAAAAAAHNGHAARGGGGGDPVNPPNNILFLENLPEEATARRLQALFQQFQGLQDIREVAGNASIAFVEFENAKQAAVALSVLQGFALTPTRSLKISYAKQ